MGGLNFGCIIRGLISLHSTTVKRIDVQSGVLKFNPED